MTMTRVEPDTVAGAMVRHPLVHGPALTVARARQALLDPHRHLLLVVSGSRLLGTVAREDLPAIAPGLDAALRWARLDGRTVRAEQSLAHTHAAMRASDVRRLAVVDQRGDLLGLLCLKASGAGFCSDAGVTARSACR